MKTSKLTFRFHDPNSSAKAAEYILAICIKSSIPKLEQAIADAAADHSDTLLDAEESPS